MSNAIASNAFVIPQRHLSGGNPETPTKGGRMRKRNNLIQIWLSDNELEKLSTQAAKCGLFAPAYLWISAERAAATGLLSDDAAALLLWE